MALQPTDTVTISLNPSTQTLSANSPVTFSIGYAIPVTNNTGFGLGLQLFWNSSLISRTSISTIFGENGGSFQGFSESTDPNNADNDPSTDRLLSLAWLDLSGNFPSPIASLFSATFTTSSSFNGTTINFGKTSPVNSFTVLPRLTINSSSISTPTNGNLQFSASTFSVNENGTPVQAVTVTRTGGDTGAVGATLNLTNGTAISPGDYNSSPIAISFASGDSTPKTIVISIVDDSLVESTEAIAISLSNPKGGATIGIQSTATLSIIDNDLNPPINPISVNVTTPSQQIGNATETAPSGVTPINSASGIFFNLSDNDDGSINSPIQLSTFAVSNLQFRLLSGNDNVIGTNGADTIFGNRGNDAIAGQDGDDIISSGIGSDSVSGGNGNDQLFGNISNDTLNGDEGNDTLRGGANSDVITGGIGNDLIYGDRNQDVLTGGTGADTFVLQTGLDFSSASLSGADVILDFNFAEGDRLGLTSDTQASSISFQAVTLSIDGQNPLTSTAILSGSNNYLAIIYGINSNSLNPISLFVNAIA
jgi:Ca2+-binding RTX toxin-like protein